MKVYIGPYTPWWVSNIYKKYMDKKYIYDWDEPTTTFEKFLEKLEDALQWVYSNTVNRIFLRMKRKIKVRVDDYDVWGMDNTLAHIIHPMLIKLKEQKHGAPLVDDEDVPEELRSTAAESKENEWNIGKRWDWVMDEMIHSFECELNENWEDQFHSGNMDVHHVPEVINDKIYYRWENGPNHTHVFDKEGYNKAWARRQNGLRLFAKYYHNLWD
jgi:hypothetical protein